MPRTHFDLLGAVASGDQVAMEVRGSGTLAVGGGPFKAGQTLRARFAIFMECLGFFRPSLTIRRSCIVESGVTNTPLRSWRATGAVG